jgi:hypothetical protein
VATTAMDPTANIASTTTTSTRSPQECFASTNPQCRDGRGNFKAGCARI